MTANRNIHDDQMQRGFCGPQTWEPLRSTSSGRSSPLHVPEPQHADDHVIHQGKADHCVCPGKSFYVTLINCKKKMRKMFLRTVVNTLIPRNPEKCCEVELDPPGARMTGSSKLAYLSRPSPSAETRPDQKNIAPCPFVQISECF